jgi:hypothetical protein
VKKRFALILGGPHAGTTRLFRRLGRHPQVLPCRVTEPHFFTDDRKWALGLDWYRSLWDFREPDDRVAIEASADYARHPVVTCPAQRVAHTPAGFRFVWLLREPVARVTAWRAARVAEGLAEPAETLGDLAAELAASRHATQLEAWREHFPTEDFLLVASEEWSARPDPVFERVCRFLEIEPELKTGESGDAPQPSGSGGRGRFARWLGRRRGPEAAHGERPEALAPELLADLRSELTLERERLAVEWGFAPTAWDRDGGR